MAETDCGFNNIPGGASGAQMLIAYGPTILVDIGFDKDFDPKATVKKQPAPGIKDVKALVDTGAMQSCIDNQLALRLNLPIIDRSVIAGVGGKHTVNMYMAQVRVPRLDHTIYGSFAGVDLAAGGQQHEALIGRTFLQKFKMTYEGATGKVTITSI